MSRSGGHVGGGPDTPWTVDHDAAGFDLINVLHLSPKIFAGAGQPSFINLAANVTGTWAAGGASSDLWGAFNVNTSAAFAGAAADVQVFEVQLNEAFSGRQAVPFFNPLTGATAAAQFYSQAGTVGFGTGSFRVIPHGALPAGAATYTLVYWNPGN